MSKTDTSTDDSDRKDLQERVDELEDELREQQGHLQKHHQHLRRMMPSRRQALKGAATAGAAAIAGFGAGSASASGLNDGDTQWGKNGNRDDYVVDHVDANSVTTDDAVPKRLSYTNGKTIYAGNQDGADADTRLDNALSAASDGDKIVLENATYTSARTGIDSIGFNGAIRGMSQSGTRTVVDANWTLDGSVTIVGLRVDGDDTLSVNGSSSKVRDISCPGTISIGGDRVTVSHISSLGTVQYDSGTEKGEAGLMDPQITQTDNGSNNFLTT